MKDKAYYTKKIINDLMRITGTYIRERQESVLEAYIVTIYNLGVRDGIAKALADKEPKPNG